MNSLPHRSALLGCVATIVSVVGFSSAVQARPKPLAGAALSVDDVLTEALTNHPTLRAAALDVQQSAQTENAEHHRYWPVLALDAATQHLENPVLNALGGTLKSTSDNVTLGSELRQQTAWGTSFTLRLEGSSSSSKQPFGAGGDNLVELGPGNNLNGRLSVNQPILRGFGWRNGQAELRRSKLAKNQAQRTLDRAASELARDVLIAYWELWYAERAGVIEQEAERNAERQWREAAVRASVGDLATVDLLTFETRVAEMAQSVVNAEALIQTRTAQLQRALGRNAATDAGVHIVNATVPDDYPLPFTDEAILAQAESGAYDVLLSKVTVKQAKEQTKTAGEQSLPRLDLNGFVQSAGLGNDDLIAPVEQATSLGAVSAQIGLVFETPTFWGRRTAQQRSASIGVRAAEARLRAVKIAVGQTVRTELISLDQAERRQLLARRTRDVAERSAVAQRERYAAGAAIALEVRTAEDTLRRAELSLMRATVDVAISRIRLLHLAGDLLGQVAPGLSL